VQPDHSGHHDVSKSVRSYWIIGATLYVFTILTVAANQVHFAEALAVIVALAIACAKGSMVASVFMHLNHEKKWIYGALLITVVFWVALMALPIFTVMDTIGTPTVHEVSTGTAHAGAVEH
jgi:caa(3)-type oxidase subunit IV